MEDILLDEGEQQMVTLRAEVERLKQELERNPEWEERRRLRLALYEAEERLVVLQHQNRRAAPTGKKAAGRAGTFGGNVRTGGGRRSAADAFSDYTRWEEAERERDASEGPTRHEQQLEAMSVGLSRTTDRQREMLLMYGYGLNVTVIARILNVDKSTVSRTIARGARRVQSYVESAEAAEKLQERPGFPDAQKPAAVDLAALLSEVTVFTPVERQAMLAAANGNSLGNIAVIINRDLDETRAILKTARAKLRFEADK